MEIKKIPFDKNNYYAENIQPLIREIISKCYVAGLPCFFAVAVKDDGVSTEFANEMISAAVIGNRLTDDRIAKFVNVIQGYSVIHPHEEITEEYLSFSDEIQKYEA